MSQQCIEYATPADLAAALSSGAITSVYSGPHGDEAECLAVCDTGSGSGSGSSAPGPAFYAGVAALVAVEAFPVSAPTNDVDVIDVAPTTTPASISIVPSKTLC